MLLILWNGLPKVLRQSAIHSSYINLPHCAALLLALSLPQFINLPHCAALLLALSLPQFNSKFKTDLFHQTFSA